MQTITEFIRLGLTKDLLKQVRVEAKKHKVSANEFIRVAITAKLQELRKKKLVEEYAKE